MAAKAASLHPQEMVEEIPNRRDLWILGADEVGAGCLAGPLVCAAFAYPLEAEIFQEPTDFRVYDSKKLSLKVRESTFESLKNLFQSHHEIVEVGVEEIDRINILQARMTGMWRACKTLLQKISEENPQSRFLVYFDGHMIPSAAHSAVKSSDGNLRCLKKGDTRLFAIAAASILAKVYRDRLMKKLGLVKSFQVYGWGSNVGYPTVGHKEAIRDNGLTEWHRKSFRCEL